MQAVYIALRKLERGSLKYFSSRIPASIVRRRTRLSFRLQPCLLQWYFLISKEDTDETTTHCVADRFADRMLEHGHEFRFRQ